MKKKYRYRIYLETIVPEGGSPMGHTTAPCSFVLEASSVELTSPLSSTTTTLSFDSFAAVSSTRWCTTFPSSVTVVSFSILGLGSCPPSTAATATATATATGDVVSFCPSMVWFGFVCLRRTRVLLFEYTQNYVV